MGDFTIKTSTIDLTILTCSICKDIFTDPIITLCGHSFCYECINTWSLNSKFCPICRNDGLKIKSLLCTIIM